MGSVTLNEVAGYRFAFASARGCWGPEAKVVAFLPKMPQRPFRRPEIPASRGAGPPPRTRNIRVRPLSFCGDFD